MTSPTTHAVSMLDRWNDLRQSFNKNFLLVLYALSNTTGSDRTLNQVYTQWYNLLNNDDEKHVNLPLNNFMKNEAALNAFTEKDVKGTTTILTQAYTYPNCGDIDAIRDAFSACLGTITRSKDSATNMWESLVGLARQAEIVRAIQATAAPPQKRGRRVDRFNAVASQFAPKQESCYDV
jgi:hypothetical protein